MKHYDDIQVFGIYDEPTSVITKKMAEELTYLPAKIYKKQHYGRDSAQLLRYDSIDAIFILYLWDSQNQRPLDENGVKSKKDIMLEYNAGIILGNKLLLRITLLKSNAGAIAASVDNISLDTLTVSIRNGSTWQPVNLTGNITNAKDEIDFYEHIFTNVKITPNNTLCFDPWIDGGLKDTSRNHIFINNDINSELYEITIQSVDKRTGVDTIHNGYIDQTMNGFANNDGRKVLVTVKRII